MTTDLKKVPLHRVTRDELPVLLEWTTKHLPGACKIYGSVYEELSGRWPGTSYYTLGWPNILAVGEGPVDPSKCKCAGYYNCIHRTSVYSPNNDYVEELLLRPEYLDWSKQTLFYVTSYENINVVERISREKGSKFTHRFDLVLMTANPGDVTPIPVPDGYELRQLDPDLHADYITTTWPYRTKHTASYISELLKTFPSYGIFDRSGECMAHELRLEYGFAGLLYAREEVRGRGLGSCIVSHTAQLLFNENRPVFSTVLVSNKQGIDFHRRLGFKPVSNVCLSWFSHSMTTDKIMEFL